MTKQSSFGPDKENLIDPRLEQIDPTPSIYNLFRQFNETFFWNSLNMVEVSWSGKQMTSCAGLCSFQPRTGYCSIRLSAPLLSLRPRKDLVETLLHEMIHAYLFITRSNKDREDHGPEFHKHMYRINSAAGTNITVYHTFNDEVRSLQRHVWRCDGPCQKWGPFYGIVRRATNRAPGPNDRWWERHRGNCSGNFQKIEEPPGYKAKNKKQIATGKLAVPKSNNDLHNFFTPLSSTKSGSGNVKGTASTGKPNLGQPKFGSNIHTFGKIASAGPKGEPISSPMPTAKPHNFHTFHDSGKLGGKVNGKTSTVVVSGKQVDSRPTKTSEVSKTPKIIGPKGATQHPSSSQPVNEHVRNVWANKFSNTATSNKDSRGLKRPALSPADEIDLLKKPKPNESQDNGVMIECPVCETFLLDREMDQHKDVCLNGSFSEEFDVSETPPSTSDTTPTNPGKGRFPCPVCNAMVTSGGLGKHLSECVDESITEDSFGSQLPASISVGQPAGQVDEHTRANDDVCQVACPICGKDVPEASINTHIDECLNLQSEEVVGARVLHSRAEHQPFDSATNSFDEQKAKCPICEAEVLIRSMNHHIDVCLNLQALNA